MIRNELQRTLDRAASRLVWHRRLWLACAVTTLLAATVPLIATATHTPENRFAFLAGIAAALTVAGIILGRRRPTHLEVARRIELIFPELNGCLLTAIEQHPDVTTGHLGFFQRQVIYDALTHSRHNDWGRVVPTKKLATAATANLLAVTIALTSFLSFKSTSHGPTNLPVAALPNAAGNIVDDDFGLVVEPGDVDVERGTSLPVIARFKKQMPASARLVARDPAGDETKLDLSRSLADTLFAGRLTNISRDVTYHIEYEGHRSREYTLTVYELPDIERIDAVVTFPTWTSLPQTELNDVRRLSVVEGCKLTITARLNNPATAVLKDASGTTLPNANSSRPEDTPTPSADDSLLFRATCVPRTSQTLRFELTDADGRHNREPIELLVEVVPNRRPDLRMTFPGRDVRVSPIEELVLEGTAWDDFGLAEAGVLCTWAGTAKASSSERSQTHTAHAIKLHAATPGRQTLALRHVLSLEDTKPQPGDVLTFCLYADDHAPDGTLRRTFGDLFFAEVRPFEEAFREGMAPPGGGSPGGGSQNPELEQFVTQQKQILQATWKVARRDPAAKPNADNDSKSSDAKSAIDTDLTTIHDAQRGLITPVREFGGKVDEPGLQAAVRDALAEMTTAADRLQAATQSQENDPLTAALSAEQAALQALVRLRAREHTIVQAQGGGGGGGSGKSQQELQQLELTNQQNRYQTQSQAKAPQETARREQLQALNRLRELARRQADVNEKLRELDPKLRKPETEQAEAEARRQLKKLREDQEQLLRDVDELRSRLDRPENQREMSDARQKLDDVRNRVQQTSEALQKGQSSKSLSAGARAEKSLSDLRDELRRKTSSQFSDAVRDLRQQARELAEKQEEIGKTLNEPNQTAGANQPGGSKRTLRKEGPPPQLADDLARQKQNVEDLLQDVRQIVEQAEASEPLLSKQLYDAARNARDHDPAENLDKASKLSQQNRLPDAAAAEKEARAGINALQAGIGKAAKSVLGDESEALRRAKSELNQLTDAVRKELESQPNARGANAEQVRIADASNDKSRLAPGPSGREPSGGNARNDKNGGPNNRSAGGSQSRDPSQPGKSSPTSAEGENAESGNSTDGNSSDNQSRSPTSKQSSESGSSPSQSDSGGKAEKASGQQGGGKSPRGGSSKDQSGSPQFLPGNSEQSDSGGSAGGAGEGPGSVGSPITGEGFTEWSDRLRDVEEMLTDDRLKAEAARIRDRARSMRVEFKRHSVEPDRELLRTTVLEPLAELQRLVADDLARRESREALAPIDRDPVPDRYSELVRRYYERLGNTDRAAKEDRGASQRK